MQTSSKISLIGFVLFCMSLFLLDWNASSIDSFNYNRILFIFTIIGLILTVIGGFLTRYDLPITSTMDCDG